MLKWLRSRRKSDAVEAEPDGVAGRHPLDAWEPPEAFEQTILWEATHERISFVDAIGLGALNGMTEREKEEFFSIYGPSEVRKEMRRRLKAREDAQKRHDKS